MPAWMLQPPSVPAREDVLRSAPATAKTNGGQGHAWGRPVSIGVDIAHTRAQCASRSVVAVSDGRRLSELRRWRMRNRFNALCSYFAMFPKDLSRDGSTNLRRAILWPIRSAVGVRRRFKHS